MYCENEGFLSPLANWQEYVMNKSAKRTLHPPVVVGFLSFQTREESIVLLYLINERFANTALLDKGNMTGIWCNYLVQWFIFLKLSHMSDRRFCNRLNAYWQLKMCTRHNPTKPNWWIWPPLFTSGPLSTPFTLVLERIFECRLAWCTDTTCRQSSLW